MEPEACRRPTVTGPCGLVFGHARWIDCRGPRAGKKEEADLREPEPPPGENYLVFKKRHRDGPHRGNA
jgi:hypothetical protein